MAPVRWRFYHSGAALCWLLDRFLPDWKGRLDSNLKLTTRALLEAELERRAVVPLGFAAAEMAGFRAKAEKDVADLAGRHPLGQGVRKLTVVGIPGRPRVDRKDGAVLVEARGLRADFKGADVRTEGETIIITLPVRRLYLLNIR